VLQVITLEGLQTALFFIPETASVKIDFYT
jgi:hypothetical protein